MDNSENYIPRGNGIFIGKNVKNCTITSLTSTGNKGSGAYIENGANVTIDSAVLNNNNTHGLHISDLEQLLYDLSKLREIEAITPNSKLIEISTQLKIIAKEYRNGGQASKSIDLYEEILEIYKINPKYMSLAAETQITLGIAHRETGDIDKAIESYSLALIKYQELSHNDPNNNETNIATAIILNNMANLYRDRKDIDQAKIHYDLALNKLSNDNADTKKVTDLILINISAIQKN